MASKQKYAPTTKHDIKVLYHNDQTGTVFRLNNIPPKMFEFFLHKKRTFKDGTSQWNIGISPADNPAKGHTLCTVRGSEEDAWREFDRIVNHYK